MSKINKNLINLITGTLMFALSVAVILPTKAGATQTPDEYRRTHKIITYNDRPVIDSLNPNPVYIGSAFPEVSVYGENFVFGAVVKLNNSDRTTTFYGSNVLTFELTGGDVSRVGSYMITVFNPGPGGGLSNGYTLNVVRNDLVINSTTSNISGGKKVPPKQATTGNTETSKANGEGGSDLLAAAIFGGNGFLPSGLIQWMILAILILLLVIIARKIYGEKKYNETPLKHA